jgi:hypothetical protein
VAQTTGGEPLVRARVPCRVRGPAWTHLLLLPWLIGCRPAPCERPTSPDPFIDPRACLPGTHEQQEASARLAALDRRIVASRWDEPVEPLNAAVAELRASRCFERSSEHAESVGAESSASLRDWWDRGGRAWLRSYLNARIPGDLIALPPTPRPVLYAEALRGTALEQLVCPHGPTTDGSRSARSLAPSLEADECGRETVAWLRAAEQAHEYWAWWVSDWQGPGSSARWGALTTGGDFLRQNPVGERCSEAIEHDLRPSYIRWRACVEAERGRMSLLPAGAFREPERGWLIAEFITFRFDFGCSEYGAYHLDSGAAHWKTCDAGRAEYHQGTVPPDRVREALLISMLAEHAVVGSPFGDGVRTPHGVPIVWPEQARPPSRRRAGAIVRVDHETSARYLWWDGDPIAHGHVHGPHHGTGAEAHARSLHLDLALLRREGAAPVELPDELWDLLERKD